MFIRFLLVGGVGFCIDAGLTYLLIQLTLTPWLARVPAILLAMAFTWFANRYFTYRVNKVRSTSEVMRYALVAMVMALINYLIYFFLVSYGIWPVAAVTLATACQTIISFHAYRHFVFRITYMNNIPIIYRNISIRIMIIMLCLILVFSFGFYMKAFDNGFSGADESSHFINSYFIFDYLRFNGLKNPMVFAQQFYTDYPKLSIGHWPPFYYMLVGILFFLFPATSVTAIAINLIITALVAASIGYIIKSMLGTVLGIIGALIYLMSPITVESMQFFMIDQPLTLIVFIAAFTWLRFTKKPSLGLSIYYGLLAAAGIMTKGNGWLLGIFPLFHIIITRKIYLLGDIRTYAGTLPCFLIVFPWYWITTKISADGFNYDFGIDYAIKALLGNLSTLNNNLGVLGCFFSILAICNYLYNKYQENDVRHDVANVSISIIISVLTLQSIVPADIANRYMMPALPFAIILEILGIELIMSRVLLLPYSRRIYNSILLLLVVLLFVPNIINFSITPQIDFRMMDVAKTIVKKDSHQIIIIDGSPSGEGAFIAEALVTSGAKNLTTIRSSKILSESDFMGKKYKLRTESLSELSEIFKNISANYIVLERGGKGNFFPHNDILEKYLNSLESGYYKKFTFNHKYRHGFTYVYALKEAHKPNFELAKELNFPKKKPDL